MYSALYKEVDDDTMKPSKFINQFIVGVVTWLACKEFFSKEFFLRTGSSLDNESEKF